MVVIHGPFLNDNQEDPMDDRPRSLFNELDLDWRRFTRSGSARRSLQRWSRLEPVLTSYDSVEALLAGLRSRKDLDQRDVVWFALLRMARTDTDARRVALFALWPGLNVVAQRYGRRWDYEDTAAEVIAAALERITAYPMRRTSSPAANIVLDVRNRLHTLRRREEALAAAVGAPASIDAALRLPSSELTGSARDLVEVVRDGVDAGCVTRRGARLILLHRVLGTPTRELASLEGRRAAAVRKARERAEAALVASAGAVA
jgi:DNA-directed RNA polymerase specialized sigma24 family protein